MDFFKKREIFQTILKYLDIPECLVLHGSRQVGKTTLMKMAMKHLEDKGEKNIFYFDLERDFDLELCNIGADEIIKYTQAKIKHKKDKIFIFIDEIQYLDNPTSLIKLLYDHYKGKYKLIVSGSSSFEIKSKFKDSLVGRSIDLEIFGLSFQEFLDFKDLKYDLKTKSDFVHKEIKNIYAEYLLYGFYPQVALAKNLELKEVYLNEIIKKYIYRDIQNLADINLDKFNKLLRFLASQNGQLVNINELSDSLNIARQTIEEYLFILENTYIIKLLRPFYKNIRSELTKMPKVYFEDLGILNLLKNKALATDFDGTDFENSIYAYLRRIAKTDNLNFWRTQSGQEIDFVVNNRKISPIEVKLEYSDKKMKNLLYFGNKYNIKELYCAVFNKKESKYKNIRQIYPWQIESIL